MNLFGWKIPDALFHDQSQENERNVLGLKDPGRAVSYFRGPMCPMREPDEPNIVGLKMPEFLFHEEPTDETDHEPSLLGWRLPKFVQNAMFDSSPVAGAPPATTVVPRRSRAGSVQPSRG